ncbi:4'-phosphopantetheinyl transferase superfamily protein [Thalassotalea sp. HSM 43]|uniref:4'-phosphopantetheinyl transferase family protein n=1 Tax=Thalassotalea sp. HSM 43 TaxID=2552945 RepID=UPI0010805F6A|nr:4'-phosphopantetheinyl transferase superfamily protein [Thalassotalea sp. HSM 43]QBY02950.1 4'-phosphopantetheinyl transferase superfamily protein [Thalassotalea sp. HSM 43]
MQGEYSTACNLAEIVSETRPVLVSDLYPGEIAQLQQKSTAAARHQWCVSRRALKQVMTKMSGIHNPDTSSLVFPNSIFSLSHSSKMSVACCALDAKGVGIDFEPWHSVSQNSWRWFLTANEVKQMQSLCIPKQWRQSIRLWSIKEALYKATPSRYQTAFIDYLLRPACNHTGVAIHKKWQTLQFQYRHYDLQDGALALAVCHCKQ